MFRLSNLPVLIALALGAGGGWAVASGHLDSLLKADPESCPASESAACPLGAGKDCCSGSDKAAAITAISAHNEKVSATLQKDGKKPNILVIWGDDIGISNISAYSDGLMGYTTPNIDRVANEGMIFTDSYAEQSCTAGRASFIIPCAV